MRTAYPPVDGFKAEDFQAVFPWASSGPGDTEPDTEPSPLCHRYGYGAKSKKFNEIVGFFGEPPAELYRTATELRRGLSNHGQWRQEAGAGRFPKRGPGACRRRWAWRTPEIRKVIYALKEVPLGDTTNAIESVNMSLRKITKNRGSFPSDDALLKLFFLALRNISKKWTMPIRDWKAALTRFTIQFEDRMNSL